MSQKLLFILNDPPYGTERSYNGLRLARALIKQENVELKMFLFGDASGCAIPGQKTPDGYYNIERMLRSVTQKGAEVGVCGACLDARGLADGPLVDGAARSNLDALTEWSLWADKVFVF
ncbi:MAG: DsrE family protein [Actinobacteria bacterium]|nr:DsrE family protein [Actinomycetota bacterium]